MKEIYPFYESVWYRQCYVLKLLPPANKVYSIDHDLELKSNFWSYVKHYLEKATKNLPTLD